MELKNFAKKAVVVALVGAFAVASLTACSSNKDSSSTAPMGKNVRGQNSTYSTK